MNPTTVALVSDIHGNASALEAVVKDIDRQEIDRVVCLGDAVQGGPQPAEVIDILKSKDWDVVMGNSDSFIVTGESKEAVSPKTMEVREWTRSQIGPEGLAFMNGFQFSLEVELGGGRKLLAFHGSPRNFDEVLLPETPLEEFFVAVEDSEQDILAGGHTHLQWSRQFNQRWFLNPGSAGAAYNRHVEAHEFYLFPFAQYAVIVDDPKAVSLEFRAVLFDVEAVHKAADRNRKPYPEGDQRLYRVITSELTTKE